MAGGSAGTRELSPGPLWPHGHHHCLSQRSKPCDTTRASKPPELTCRQPPSMRPVRPKQRKRLQLQTAAASPTTVATASQALRNPASRGHQHPASWTTNHGSERVGNAPRATQPLGGRNRMGTKSVRFCRSSTPSDRKPGPYRMVPASRHPHPGTAQRPWEHQPQRGVCTETAAREL